MPALPADGRGKDGSMARTAGRRGRRGRELAGAVYGTRPLLEVLEPRVLLTATPIFTYHVDNQSTGVNSTEVLLTPADVNSAQFGKEFSTSVDGQVFAEPLYVPGVDITAVRSRACTTSFTWRRSTTRSMR